MDYLDDSKGRGIVFLWRLLKKNNFAADRKLKNLKFLKIRNIYEDFRIQKFQIYLLKAPIYLNYKL